jgi:hypothetical protein
MSTTKDLVPQLAKAAGYCCVYSLLFANRKTRTALLAARLGIEPRTLKYWRRALLLRKITRCPRCPRLQDLYIPLGPPR